MPRTSLFLLTSRAIHKTKIIPKLAGGVREPLSCVSSTVHTHLPFKFLANRNNKQSSVWNKDIVAKIGQHTSTTTLLDIYLLRPHNLLTSCNTVPGISDHGVLLEVEWDEICQQPKM
jgi:hypothetical protein